LSNILFFAAFFRKSPAKCLTTIADCVIMCVMNLQEILTRVEKPARYVGGEFGEVSTAHSRTRSPASASESGTPKGEAELRFVLCFPDTYEIGMSNLGLQILYNVLNTTPNVSCERCFSPWPDMANELQRANLPLFALESGSPLGEFDVIGFSLGYEMAYPELVRMLTLANIPAYATDRAQTGRSGLQFPLIIAGGACMANPEPIAPFIDLAVFGDGEDAVIELAELVKLAKRDGWDRPRLLSEAARLEGVYVPTLGNDYKRRVVKDFDAAPFPVKPIVPSMEVVHDRAVIELMRGCPNGCKFCQACFINAPLRFKTVDTLVTQAIAVLKHTGAQELNLASLSTGDYPGLAELVTRLLDYCEPRHINLSLPSLRADSLTPELFRRIQRTRKSGLTIAPEAGSQRLRDVINKNLSEEQILNACKTAFEQGHSAVKLYFMIGLPTETDEDVLAIGDLAFKILDTWKRFATMKKRPVQITVSAACFVPKPKTPFANEPQNSVEELIRKQQLLRERLKSKSIKFSWHSPQVSQIEWFLAKGGRELAPVIAEVAGRSRGPQAWDEFFDYALWQDALAQAQIYS
jgi:radical SAM superfamily enzyme YgiQ (UPF0313 family)